MIAPDTSAGEWVGRRNGREGNAFVHRRRPAAVGPKAKQTGAIEVELSIDPTFTSGHNCATGGRPSRETAGPAPPAGPGGTTVIIATLGAQGRTTVNGLCGDRPTVPFTRLIFQALASIRIIPATSGNPHTIAQPTPRQLEILDLLDVNPLEWC